MRISIELVPRDRETVLEDASVVRNCFPNVHTINIPDLMRFQLRSWEACALSARLFLSAIPHIRAIDIPPHQELPMAAALAEAGISEVLVVAGDRPQDMSRTVYPTTSIDVIRRFKRDLPHLKVYAAFDPYRHGFRTELEYAARKLDSGADGFFTQPIFDLRLLEICAEMIAPEAVFWGVAPVMSSRSRAYWETTNRIVFPADFRPDLKWNRTFAREALDLVQRLGSNLYFMPIRVDLGQYLEGIL